ncbi:MAG: hypothetical protein ACI9JE_001812, partial [Candidatus Krumholzibacteriia bacterium]
MAFDLRSRVSFRSALLALLMVTILSAPDARAQSEVTAAIVDSLLAESDLPQPTPQAIEIEPVNLWD